MYSSYSQVIQVVKSFKHLFTHMQVTRYYTLPFSQVVMYSAYCRDTSVNNIISHMLVYVQNKILEVELLFPRVYSFVILINTISLSSLRTVPICITTSNECRKVPLPCVLISTMLQNFQLISWEWGRGSPLQF